MEIVKQERERGEGKKGGGEEETKKHRETGKRGAEETRLINEVAPREITVAQRSFFLPSFHRGGLGGGGTE